MAFFANAGLVLQFGHNCLRVVIWFKIKVALRYELHKFSTFATVLSTCSIVESVYWQAVGIGLYS